MKFIKKNFLNIFLVFYITIGSVASINTGISHDELHEQENWKYNVALTKHLTNHIFLNTEYDLQYEKYTDKYYGIGFQIVSQPIQLILKKIIL